MATKKEMYAFLDKHADTHDLMNNKAFLAADKEDQDMPSKLQKEFNLSRSEALRIASGWGLNKMGMPGYGVNEMRHILSFNQLNESEASDISDRTVDAYSRDMYVAGDWEKIAAFLLREYTYTPEDVEFIMNSKWMRWIADRRQQRSHGKMTYGMFRREWTPAVEKSVNDMLRKEGQAQKKEAKGAVDEIVAILKKHSHGVVNPDDFLASAEAIVAKYKL